MREQEQRRHAVSTNYLDDLDSVFPPQPRIVVSVLACNLTVAPVSGLDRQRFSSFEVFKA
jgi:hypothetical protein